MPARSRLSVTALAFVTAASASAVPWTIPPYVVQRISTLARMNRKIPTVDPQTQAKADEILRHIQAKQGNWTATPPPTPTQTTTEPPPKVPPVGRTVASKPHSVDGWMKSMITNRIDITGNRILGFHQHSVEGDRDAFDSLTYYGQGGSKFTDNGQMTVQGNKVLGFLDFQMAVTDNRIQDPYNQRTTLSYARGPLSVTYGDVRADLTNTNQFARFSRQLNGTSVGWKSGRTEFRAVHSVSRGSARTVSFEGNNSAGPYYLQSGRVLADTLEVQLDGQTMRLGEDYVLDSDLGAITFINRTISPTSAIVASYEAQSFNEASGTLQGGGFAYDFGRMGRLGLTMIQQTGTGDPGSRTLSQLFQGYGSASQWYALDYVPVDGTLRVRVSLGQSGFVDVPPAQLEIDPLLPNRFRVLFDVSPDQTLLVDYRPKATTVAVGDRRTTGVDWRMPFGNRGKNGFLQLDYADGRSLGSDGIGGIAKGASIDYRAGDLRVRTGVRDVPATFVTVESRGFNRNERAWNLNVDYARGRYTYGVNHQNSAIGILSSDLSQGTLTSRAVTSSGFVNYSDPSGVRWGFQQSRSLGNRFGESRLDTSSLTGARTFLKGRLDLNTGLDYQTGHGPMSNGTDLVDGDVRLMTARTGFDWRLGGGLSTNARMGISRVSSPQGDGNGRDLSYGLNYRPNDRWSLALSRTDSDSGQAATLAGFSSGFGYGYGGNGFSSGSVGDIITAGASSLKSTYLSTDFRATRRLSLSGRAYQTTTEGDLSSNSDTQGYGVAMNYDLGGFQNLTLSLDRSRTSFIGSESSVFAGTTESTSYTFAFSGAPRGRFNYNLAASGLISQGGLGFAGQDSLLLDTGIGYRLNDRQRVSFGYSQGRSRGFYGQNEFLTSAAYEYRLWGNVALRGIYRWRNVANVDPTQTSGAYRSHGLDFELSFDFGR
ncbi:hypothetical protein BH11ARM2_BH11ARM2_01690 [soil metagenome]